MKLHLVTILGDILMKKLAIIVAAVAAVALLASCSSSKPAPMKNQPTAQHHNSKGEMDYKGELRQK
jgi:outer membrane biogenesis lipoprotein LolB